MDTVSPIAAARAMLGLTEAGARALSECATTGKASGVAADKLVVDGFIRRLRSKRYNGAPTAKGFEALRVLRQLGARV